MRAVKIVVGGAFNAGKSQLIAAASEIAPVSTERRVTDHTAALKPLTTAAMDYGRLTVAPGLALHLYGTPGQRRFDFMWQALARGMRGLLLVVDSGDPASFAEAHHILAFFRALGHTPTAVAANKQDRPGALSPAALRDALDLGEDVAVLPCVATDPASARGVLRSLLGRVSLPDASSPTLPAAPIAPRAPAPLAAVEWAGARQHLSAGGGATLCGREIPAAALPALIYSEAGCQLCARAAIAAGMACAGCGRPLTRSQDGRLCLGCAQHRRTAPRDAIAFLGEL